MKTKISKNVKAAVAFNLIIIGFVAAFLVTTQTVDPMVKQTIYAERITLAWLGDPAGDTSGFCNFYHYPHQADPATAYATNLSSDTAYEYIDALSGEMTGETPHSTTHDYVLKLVVNDTVAYNTSSASWEPTWIFMNMTMDYNFGSDIDWSQMTLVEIGNNTDYAWYHGHLNNAGAGYTLSQNQRTNATFNCTIIF